MTKEKGSVSGADCRKYFNFHFATCKNLAKFRFFFPYTVYISAIIVVKIHSAKPIKVSIVQTVGCFPGFGLNEDHMCAPCGIGYYNPDIGGNCIRCKSGMTTERMGANMTSDCSRHRCCNLCLLRNQISVNLNFVSQFQNALKLHGVSHLFKCSLLITT